MRDTSEVFRQVPVFTSFQAMDGYAIRITQALGVVEPVLRIVHLACKEAVADVQSGSTLGLAYVVAARHVCVGEVR